MSKQTSAVITIITQPDGHETIHRFVSAEALSIVEAVLSGRVKITNPHFRNPRVGTTRYEMYVTEGGYDTPWQPKGDDDE